MSDEKDSDSAGELVEDKWSSADTSSDERFHFYKRMGYSPQIDMDSMEAPMGLGCGGERFDYVVEVPRVNFYIPEPVERLRTCQDDKRKDFAVLFAKTRADVVLLELIRMVEGRRRLWFSWYGLEDQLVGVEALGETNSKDAKDYLDWLNITKPYLESTSGYFGAHTDYEYDIYPNARGRLRKELKHCKGGMCYTPKQLSPGLVDSTDWVSGPHPSKEHERAHKILYQSIKKLEGSLPLAT